MLTEVADLSLQNLTDASTTLLAVEAFVFKFKSNMIIFKTRLVASSPHEICGLSYLGS